MNKLWGILEQLGHCQHNPTWPDHPTQFGTLAANAGGEWNWDCWLGAVFSGLPFVLYLFLFGGERWWLLLTKTQGRKVMIFKRDHSDQLWIQIWCHNKMSVIWKYLYISLNFPKMAVWVICLWECKGLHNENNRTPGTRVSFSKAWLALAHSPQIPQQHTDWRWPMAPWGLQHGSAIKQKEHESWASPCVGAKYTANAALLSYLRQRLLSSTVLRASSCECLTLEVLAGGSEGQPHAIPGIWQAS